MNWKAMSMCKESRIKVPGQKHGPCTYINEPTIILGKEEKFLSLYLCNVQSYTQTHTLYI